jgi:hypothetical protein
MTIRGKLYAAIALTIIGPLLTTVVALEGQARLGDSFDEVQDRSRHESLALEVKFAVTDMNGWQTAYGYAGDGRFRLEFSDAASRLEQDLARADSELTESAEQALVGQLQREFVRFMAGDRAAYAALRAGQKARVKQLLLGPELVRFQDMAATASRLAEYEVEQAAKAQLAFDEDRDRARKRLIAVALGAAMVIVLLLVTAQDVVRLALEGARGRGNGD